MAALAGLEPGLQRTLRLVRRRLWLVRLIRLGVRGLAAGAAMAAVAALLPIPFAAGRVQIVLGLFAAGPLAALGIVLFQAPTLAETARSGDRAAGLEERLITALELAGRRGPLVAEQQAETGRALSGVDWRKRLPLRLSLGWLGTAMACAVLAMGLLARPLWLSAADAAEAAAVGGALDQFELALSRRAVANALEYNAEIQAAINRLYLDLQRVRTRVDTSLAIGRAAEAVGRVAAGLSQAGQEALQELPGGALDHLVSRLAEALQNQDWQMARQLLRTLEDAQRLLPDGAGAEQAYREQVADAAMEVRQVLTEARAVEAAEEALEEARVQVEQVGPQEAQLGRGPLGQDELAEMLGVARQPGSGALPESGSESAAGQAGGSGSEQMAEGGGEVTAGQPGQRAEGEGELGFTKYDRIFAPDRLGGESAGFDRVNSDRIGDGSGGQGGLTPTPEAGMSGGSMRPYQEVLGTYSRQAGQVMQRANLDPAVQDLVREYFAGLEAETGP